MSAVDPTPAEREPISYEELALAARNHGMPLEGLRYDITPVGMHYLLIHFDIPAADAETWTIDVGGLVERPLTLSVADLRSRPAVTMPVTMECAGNGRARLDPRPLSQPWLDEAIGTGTWTGTPLGPILAEAGLGPIGRGGRVPRCRPRHAARRRARLRAQPVGRRRDARRRAPGLRAERTTAATAARLPGASAGPGLVRHDEREVAPVDHRGRRAVRRATRCGPTASGNTRRTTARPSRG